jgi:hypothetical protein
MQAGDLGYIDRSLRRNPAKIDGSGYLRQPLDCSATVVPRLGMDGSNTKRGVSPPIGTPCVRIVACAAVLLCGCNLFTDLDRFEERGTKDAGNSAADAGDAGMEVPGCESPRTLCLRLDRFTPHVDELVVADLVSEGHILRARAMLDPLANGGATADIVLPQAIDATEVPAKGKDHPLHLEIFGDKTGDRMYNPEGGDHDWKVPLPPDAHLTFEHNSNFVRLTPRPQTIGGDFRMSFAGMKVHIGKMLEVMVIESETGRTVGLYRLQSIPGDAFEIAIPDIIDVGGVVYRIEFYADANDNHEYDALPTDHTWVLFGESDDKELHISFTHGTDFKPLVYQRKFAE